MATEGDGSVSRARLVKRDSEVHGVGYPFVAWDRGLYIETNNAIIERNIFSHNLDGIVLGALTVEINDNTFEYNNGHGIYIFGSMYTSIYDNIIQNNAFNGIFVNAVNLIGPLMVYNNNTQKELVSVLVVVVVELLLL